MKDFLAWPLQTCVQYGTVRVGSSLRLFNSGTALPYSKIVSSPPPPPFHNDLICLAGYIWAPPNWVLSALISIPAAYIANEYYSGKGKGMLRGVTGRLYVFFMVLTVCRIRIQWVFLRIWDFPDPNSVVLKVELYIAPFFQSLAFLL